MTTVYIAGPMTGYPLYNFPAFRNAARYLRQAGFTVVSPAELDEQMDGFNPVTDEAKSGRHYMSRDLPALLMCDEVAVMGDWKKSKHTCLEVTVALTCDVPVIPIQMYCAQSRDRRHTHRITDYPPIPDQPTTNPLPTHDQPTKTEQ